jgi:hypothetical protein
MAKITRELITLPCHTITTCHYGRTKDSATKETFVSIMLPGQSAEQIPILFPEMYVLQRNREGKRTLLTENDGVYRAGTRIGRGGLFDKYEKPDIRHLLKKAGKDYEDVEI